jgi:hypothetical protein
MEFPSLVPSADRSPLVDTNTVHKGEIVRCHRYRGKGRGSIVCTGQITRVRKNGTFDVLYEDGLKEIGVKPASIVPKTSPRPTITVKKEATVAKKTGRSKHWGKVRMQVKLQSALAKAREEAAEEEQLLLNDGLRHLRNQRALQKAKNKRGGHLKGDAGLAVVDEMKDLRIASELGGQGQGGTGGAQGQGKMSKEQEEATEAEAAFKLTAIRKRLRLKQAKAKARALKNAAKHATVSTDLIKNLVSFNAVDRGTAEIADKLKAAAILSSISSGDTPARKKKTIELVTKSRATKKPGQSQSGLVQRSMTSYGDASTMHTRKEEKRERKRRAKQELKLAKEQEERREKTKKEEKEQKKGKRRESRSIFPQLTRGTAARGSVSFPRLS